MNLVEIVKSKDKDKIISIINQFLEGKLKISEKDIPLLVKLVKKYSPEKINEFFEKLIKILEVSKVKTIVEVYNNLPEKRQTLEKLIESKIKVDFLDEDDLITLCEFPKRFSIPENQILRIIYKYIKEGFKTEYGINISKIDNCIKLLKYIKREKPAIEFLKRVYLDYKSVFEEYKNTPFYRSLRVYMPDFIKTITELADIISKKYILVEILNKIFEEYFIIDVEMIDISKFYSKIDDKILKLNLAKYTDSQAIGLRAQTLVVELERKGIITREDRDFLHNLAFDNPKKAIEILENALSKTIEKALVTYVKKLYEYLLFGKMEGFYLYLYEKEYGKINLNISEEEKKKLLKKYEITTLEEYIEMKMIGKLDNLYNSVFYLAICEEIYKIIHSNISKENLIKTAKILYLLDLISKEELNEISKGNFELLIKKLKEISEMEMKKIIDTAKIFGETFGYSQKSPLLALINKITDSLNKIYKDLIEKAKSIKNVEIPYELKHLILIRDYILEFDKKSGLFFLITPNGMKIFKIIKNQLKDVNYFEESEIEYALWRIFRKIKKNKSNLSSVIELLN
jgi:hypothetical protein